MVERTSFGVSHFCFSLRLLLLLLPFGILIRAHALRYCRIIKWMDQRLTRASHYAAPHGTQYGIAQKAMGNAPTSWTRLKYTRWPAEISTAAAAYVRVFVSCVKTKVHKWMSNGAAYARASNTYRWTRVPYTIPSTAKIVLQRDFSFRFESSFSVLAMYTCRFVDNITWVLGALHG